jgi:hypothetical protein
MLSEKLTEIPPKEEYKEINDDCFFIGAKVKNLYDEQRICIQDNYSPGRYKIKNADYFLFGIKHQIPNEFKLLASRLKQNKIYDLIGYTIALQDFSLTCNDCYFNLRPPLYPVDTHHIKKCLKDFDYENFICFNPEVPKFQAFTSLNLFFIAQA